MMRCSTGSQWRLYKDGVARSNFLKPQITFAAAFWTNCSLVIWYLYAQQSNPLFVSSLDVTYAYALVFWADPQLDSPELCGSDGDGTTPIYIHVEPDHSSSVWNRSSLHTNVSYTWGQVGDMIANLNGWCFYLFQCRWCSKDNKFRFIIIQFQFVLPHPTPEFSSTDFVHWKFLQQVLFILSRFCANAFVICFSFWSMWGFWCMWYLYELCECWV